MIKAIKILYFGHTTHSYFYNTYVCYVGNNIKLNIYMASIAADRALINLFHYVYSCMITFVKYVCNIIVAKLNILLFTLYLLSVL